VRVDWDFRYQMRGYRKLVRPMVVFSNFEGLYSGVGLHGRNWRITPVRTGWRLEFVDPGDGIATYAGTFSSVEVAQGQAF
jgi:hypothetical protein